MSILDKFIDHLPTKENTERIVPYVTLFVTFIGGAWLLYQYSLDNKAKRVESVIRLHQQFIGSDTTVDSLKDMQGKFDADLLLIVELAIKSVKQTNEENKICQTKAKSNTHNRYFVERTEACQRLKENDIKKKIREFITKQKQLRVYSPNNIVKIRKLLAHYSSVIACANSKACDKRTVIRIYGDEMLSYINAFCDYFEEDSANWKKNEPDDAVVSRFLVNYWHYRDNSVDWSDQCGEMPFFCNFHNSLLTKNNCP